MRASRILQVAIGLAILGGAVYLSLASAAPATEIRETPTRRVQVAPVEPARGSQALRFAGTLRSSQRADLAFTVAGRLAARPVVVGQRVAAGQLLARLDAVELAHAADAAAAALGETEARLAQTRRDRSRVERLLAAKAATPEELEQTGAAVDALEAAQRGAAARLREARRRLSEATLTAPYAGTVTDVLAEPGEYLPAGRPVVVVSGDGDLEVEVGVPESLLPHLAVGEAVAVELPLAGSAAPAAGRVRSAGRAAAGAGRLFPVVVAVAARPGLMAGMSAEVLLRQGGGGELSVPLAAVLNPGGSRPTVFAVRGGAVAEVPVEVGALVGGRVVVTGELATGDEVVVAGHSGLMDGDGVEVMP